MHNDKSHSLDIIVVLHTDLVLAMVLMIHLSVELVNDKLSNMNQDLKTSLLTIALLQVTIPYYILVLTETIPLMIEYAALLFPYGVPFK